MSQALTILAVTLEPYGGLAWAARDNVRKLEARYNLPVGDLDAVPAVIHPPVTESVTPPPVESEQTTTPGGKE